jgi:hypothetical protein
MKPTNLPFLLLLLCCLLVTLSLTILVGKLATATSIVAALLGIVSAGLFAKGVGHEG